MNMQVVEHQITLRFLFPEGLEITRAAEQAVIEGIQDVPGWMYATEYGYNEERFTLFDPELDGPIPNRDWQAKPSDLIWTLTFGSTHKIPATAAECTVDDPVAIETMVLLLQKHVLKHVPHLTYLRSTEYIKFQCSVSTDLPY